jgi:hypothetical protein
MKYKQGRKYKLSNLEDFLKSRESDLYDKIFSLKKKRGDIKRILKFSEIDEQTKQGLSNSIKRINDELENLYNQAIDLLEEEQKIIREQEQQRVREQEAILAQLPPPPAPLKETQLSNFVEIRDLRFKRTIRQYEARFNIEANFTELPLDERLRRTQEDLLAARNKIIALLRHIINEGMTPPYKLDIIYRAVFYDVKNDEESERFIRTGYHTIMSISEIKERVDELVLDILASRKFLSRPYENENYNIVFYYPVSIIVAISRYDPGAAMIEGWTNEDELIKEFKEKGYDKHSCSEVELPKSIENKKACINVKNKDNKCFLWAVLRSLYPREKDPQRISDLLEHEKEIDLCGIELPFDINISKSSKLKKFEEVNNLSLFIFHLTSKIQENQEIVNIYPLYKSKTLKDNSRNIFLLIHRKHFFVIKNLSKLLGDEIGEHKRHFCPNCLCSSRKPQKLETHKKYCLNNFDPIKSSIPDSKLLEFKRQDALQWSHFAVFCDFECIFSNNRFIPVSVSVFCEVFNIFEFIVDPDPYELNKKLWKVYFTILDKFKQIIVNPCSVGTDSVSDKNTSKPPDNIKRPIQGRDKCWICNEVKKLCKTQNGKVYYDKLVIDHDHVTGEFRGYAHNSCNLNLRLDRIKIPIYFHNGSGFDFHLIIKYLPFDLLKEFEVENIVAKSTEKFMSFDIGNLRFIDSLNLLITKSTELVLFKLSQYIQNQMSN